MMRAVCRLSPRLLWVAVAIASATYARQIASGGHKWKTGDWLINYEGGFVRRGLSGSVLFVLSGAGVPLLWLTFALQVAVFAAVVWLVVRLYDVRDRPRGWAILLFSPAFVLFPLHQVEGAFRKETLLFLALLPLALGVARASLRPPVLVASLALYALACFSHEVAAFCLPFILYLLARARSLGDLESRRAVLAGAAFASLAIVSLLLAAAFPGDAATARAICASLQARGVGPAVCGGAIDWLGRDLQFGLSRVAQGWPGRVAWLAVVVALVLAPLAGSAWVRRRAGLLAMGLAVMAPLFLSAVDWGRWVHVYASCLFIVVIAVSNREDVDLPAFPAWFVAAYVLTWSVDYVSGLGGGLVQEVARQVAVRLS
jgi:hypothetical protein